MSVRQGSRIGSIILVVAVIVAAAMLVSQLDSDRQERAITLVVTADPPNDVVRIKWGIGPDQDEANDLQPGETEWRWTEDAEVPAFVRIEAEVPDPAMKVTCQILADGEPVGEPVILEAGHAPRDICYVDAIVHPR